MPADCRKKSPSLRVRSLQILKFSARLEEKFLFFCSVNEVSQLSKGPDMHHSWCNAGNRSVRTAGEVRRKRTGLSGSVC